MFIHNSIKQAKEYGDIKKAKEVRAIMSREVAKKIWIMINRARKKKHGQAIEKVTVAENGETIELIDQIAIERAIMVNNDKLFNLAYETPLLDEGKTHKDLDYIANTEEAKENILGTYNFPPQHRPSHNFTITADL